LEVVAVVLLAGLPVAAIASLGSRLLTATRRTAALPAFAVSAVVLNLLGDVVGARFYGAAGIAGATVLMRSVNAVLFLLYAKRLIARLEAGLFAAPRSLRLSTPVAVFSAEAPR